MASIIFAKQSNIQLREDSNTRFSITYEPF